MRVPAVQSAEHSCADLRPGTINAFIRRGRVNGCAEQEADAESNVCCLLLTKSEGTYYTDPTFPFYSQIQ